MTTTLRAIDLVCTYCGSGRGKRCKSRRGRGKPLPYFHSVRACQAQSPVIQLIEQRKGLGA